MLVLWAIQHSTRLLLSLLLQLITVLSRMEWCGIVCYVLYIFFFLCNLCALLLSFPSLFIFFLYCFQYSCHGHYSLLCSFSYLITISSFYPSCHLWYYVLFISSPPTQYVSAQALGGTGALRIIAFYLVSWLPH